MTIRNQLRTNQGARTKMRICGEVGQERSRARGKLIENWMRKCQEVSSCVQTGNMPHLSNNQRDVASVIAKEAAYRSRVIIIIPQCFTIKYHISLVAHLLPEKASVGNAQSSFPISAPPTCAFVTKKPLFRRQFFTWATISQTTMRAISGRQWCL